MFLKYSPQRYFTLDLKLASIAFVLKAFVLKVIFNLVISCKTVLNDLMRTVTLFYLKLHFCSFT